MFDRLKINHFYKLINSLKPKHQSKAHQLYDSAKPKLQDKIVHDQRFISVLPTFLIKSNSTSNSATYDYYIIHHQALEKLDDDKLKQAIHTIFTYFQSKNNNEKIKLHLNQAYNYLVQRFIESPSSDTKDSIINLIQLAPNPPSTFIHILKDTGHINLLDNYDIVEFIKKENHNVCDLIYLLKDTKLQPLTTDLLLACFHTAVKRSEIDQFIDVINTIGQDIQFNPSTMFEFLSNDTVIKYYQQPKDTISTSTSSILDLINLVNNQAQLKYLIARYYGDDDLKTLFNNVLTSGDTKDKNYHDELKQAIFQSLGATVQSSLTTNDIMQYIQSLEKPDAQIINDLLNNPHLSIDNQDIINILFSGHLWKPLITLDGQGIITLDPIERKIIEVFNNITDNLDQKTYLTLSDNIKHSLYERCYIRINLEDSKPIQEIIKEELSQVLFQSKIWLSLPELANKQIITITLSPIQTHAITIYQTIDDQEEQAHFQKYILSHLTHQSKKLDNYTEEEYKQALGTILINEGLWKGAFTAYNSHLIHLDDKTIAILKSYQEVIDDRAQLQFKNHILNTLSNQTIEELPTDKIKYLPELLNKITYSNSNELYHIMSELIPQLLNSEHPLEYYETIEKVFLQNNIPYVGKIYKVFDTLYSSETVSQMMSEQSNTISPILQQMKTRYRDLIFYDLIKVSMGSNNRSMKEYLDNIEEGNQLFINITRGNLTFDKINPKERQILKIFTKHLETLYRNTKEYQHGSLSLTGNIIDDIQTLSTIFKGDKALELKDQIVRYFTLFKTFDEAKHYMTDVIKKTHERNIQTSTEPLRLYNGDFIRGIGNINNLEKILQNGSLAGEYIGENAKSDTTPFDTDISLMVDTTDVKVSDLTFEQALEKVPSIEFGPIYLLLKGDDRNDGREKRFCFTRRCSLEKNMRGKDYPDSDKHNLKQYEVFYSGQYPDQPVDYGLRTGFPSSEIDCFVIDPQVVNKNQVALEIAMNGFYIPIYNLKTSKLIFSIEDYEKLRAKMSGLSHFGCLKYNFASNEELTSSPEISTIINALEESNANIQIKRNIITESIKASLTTINPHIKLKTTIDGDVTEGSIELLDNGSTGRETNDLDIQYPDHQSNVDFDFILRIDKRYFMDQAKMQEIKNQIIHNFASATQIQNSSDIKAKEVKIKGLDEPVNIDITFVQKTDKMDYSSDTCIKDRMETIHKQDPEKHKQIIANIILAKQILKKGGCYKPNRPTQNIISEGGLGGIGVENWILQNGGSLEKAAKEFMSVASQCENFEEFKSKYQIWDFGKNHKTKETEYPHDNFVEDHMSEVGYQKMKQVLEQYLKSLKPNQVNPTNENIKLEEPLTTLKSR